MKNIKVNPRAYLAIILLSLFVTAGCDLFTGPKVDLFKVIGEEVDWANAKKVVVTVDFPPEWGVSPQRGTGKCGDTRVGYEFDLNFAANPEYAMLGWRVYKTSDLSPNWLKNPAYYINSVPQFEGVTMPLASEQAGLSDGQAAAVRSIIATATFL